jgi:hypothetical protein
MKSTVQHISVKYVLFIDLSMATDEDDIISDGKLFHKNTIMLKYEFRKSEVLYRFARRSPELERVEW